MKEKGPLEKQSEMMHKRAAFLNAFRRTGSFAKSCEIAAVSRQRVMGWMRNKEFYDQYIEIREQNIAEIEGIVFDQALAGDASQARFLLRSWKPSVYSPQSNMNVNVNENVEIRVAGLDPDEAKQNLAKKVLGHLKSLPGGQELIGMINDREAVPAQVDGTVVKREVEDRMD